MKLPKEIEEKRRELANLAGQTCTSLDPKSENWKSNWNNLDLAYKYKFGFQAGFDAALDPKVLIHHPMVRELVDSVNAYHFDLHGFNPHECETCCAMIPWKEVLDE